jgi:hypothetical protein
LAASYRVEHLRHDQKILFLGTEVLSPQRSCWKPAIFPSQAHG